MFRHLHPATHHRRHILWPRTEKVDFLRKVGKGFPDVNLYIAPVLLPITWVDNCVLQIDEGLLRTRIKFLGTHEGGGESFGAILAWRLAFDRERGLRFFGEQIVNG